MRCVGIVVICIGLALSAGHAAERAPQATPLSEYVNTVCIQAGLKADCDGNWRTFVQAGMNDIDQRCDAFLAWATDRSRGKKPANDKTVLGMVMTLSGPDPDLFEIVAAAFGLPSPSHDARSVPQLSSVDRLTVVQTVFASRMQFRDKIKNDLVSDRSAAIHLLRDYLWLCMPSTIKASLNISGAK